MTLKIIPDLTIRELGVGPGQDYWPTQPGAQLTLPWAQPGGGGTPIVTTDPLAGVQSGVVNNASGEVSVCLGGSLNTASGGGCVCLGGFANIASGSSSGVYSCFVSTSSGTTSVCIGSNGATASNFCSVCLASAGGVASGKFAACIGGTNGIAAGDNSVSIGGGNAPNNGDIAIGNASANAGFFGVPCVPQQPAGGTGIAGPVYGANEQAMLQAVYNALKNFGLIA